MKAQAILLLAALSMTGCGMSLPQVTAATNTTISTAQADLQKAINLYQIAKGIAQVGVTADPALGPLVTAVIAAVDPLVAQVQAMLNSATTDANTLEALASQIRAQANTLTLQAAPSIKAVPNTNATAGKSS